MPSLSMVELTDAEFESFISVPRLTLVQFWARWSGQCRHLGQLMNRLANASVERRIRFGRIDIEFNQETPQRFDIRNVPAVAYFRDGHLLKVDYGIPETFVFKQVPAGYIAVAPFEQPVPDSWESDLDEKETLQVLERLVN